MRILIACLTYGNRSEDILIDNLYRSRYDHAATMISVEGIAQALNVGINTMLGGGYDAIAFLANDIIEPDGWLAAKVKALKTYQNAGIVATPFETHDMPQNQHIIGNWLISRETIATVGMFNEEFTPYGPIDLDYCDRCHLSGIKTYYISGSVAVHSGDHCTGDEYGYNKRALVDQQWPKYLSNLNEYRNGTKPLKIWPEVQQHLNQKK